jgi:hypothetical protein
MKTVEAGPFRLTSGLNTRIGLLRTYVPEEQLDTAIRNEATTAEAAAQAKKLNTYAHVAREFGEEGYNPRLLVRNKYTRILRPAAPYTDSAILVAVVGPKFAHIDTSKEPTPQETSRTVQTHSIYTLPWDVQVAYWRDIRKSVKVLKDFIKDTGDPKEYTIFAAENNILELTNPETRTSRSIALPHTHILAINHNTIEEVETIDPNMQHVLEEQEILYKIGEDLGDEVYKNLSTANKYKLNGRISGRMDMPFGYSMRFKKGLSDEDFADMMYGHNEAYTTAILEFPELLIDATIPQPSQRIYLFDNEVIFVPEFISSGGVMEAAGVELDRSPNYKQRIKQEEIVEINTRLKAAFGDVSTQKDTQRKK